MAFAKASTHLVHHYCCAVAPPENGPVPLGQRVEQPLNMYAALIVLLYLYHTGDDETTTISELLIAGMAFRTTSYILVPIWIHIYLDITFVLHADHATCDEHDTRTYVLVLVRVPSCCCSWLAYDIIIVPYKLGYFGYSVFLHNYLFMQIMRCESPTYILNEDTQPVMRAIGVSHTACKDEFRRNLRSHSWSVF